MGSKSTRKSVYNVSRDEQGDNEFLRIGGHLVNYASSKFKRKTRQTPPPPPPPMSASGGVTYTPGNGYKYHRFSEPNSDNFVVNTLSPDTSKNKIDYINTHGTSTPVGDITELKAVGEVFKDSVPKISSTKSLSGHSLGATSVHEAVYSLIMMKNNFISASVNITDMDEEAKKFPIVTKVEKNVKLNSVMSNSFGFGGTNATLVFEKV